MYFPGSYAFAGRAQGAIRMGITEELILKNPHELRSCMLQTITLPDLILQLNIKRRIAIHVYTSRKLTFQMMTLSAF
jgi:hypothetical protein